MNCGALRRAMNRRSLRQSQRINNFGEDPWQYW
jgi:hypothetical protein